MFATDFPYWIPAKNQTAGRPEQELNSDNNAQVSVDGARADIFHCLLLDSSGQSMNKIVTKTQNAQSENLQLENSGRINSCQGNNVERQTGDAISSLRFCRFSPISLA